MRENELIAKVQELCAENEKLTYLVARARHEYATLSDDCCDYSLFIAESDRTVDVTGVIVEPLR